MTETNRVEFKEKLTDTLEKEVVAFLNYKEGGVIYLGIDKDGNSKELRNLGVKSLLFTKICYNTPWQEKNEWKVSVFIISLTVGLSGGIFIWMMKTI